MRSGASVIERERELPAENNTTLYHSMGNRRSTDVLINEDEDDLPLNR